MAQKVNVILVDDVDGGEADETIQFRLDSAHYEIDLSLRNAGERRAALAPYIEKASKVTGRTGQPGQPRKPSASDRIRRYGSGRKNEVLRLTSAVASLLTSSPGTRQRRADREAPYHSRYSLGASTKRSSRAVSEIPGRRA